ncbi:ribonuclease D [Marinobacter nanhaiticus D15-8W]|uniref:Ribonuclease D n=1 Tax=Marinobacter nanhaiticus D15-8W TaxID=626887 RepID=N6WZS5_9GAMM|nr:HRDC domain-containing protein [Marinobacter nanhaiticus]ENO14273.1 ribonuclease D [Marinobacter nanhaiticus D15-8W]BES71661.1 ribonuclease D [Marinobacter nanhaiticus D15-8W]
MSNDKAVRWLETASELDDWLASRSDTPLALDTEFERVNTFFPIPGLVQLGLDDDLRLVEPSVAEASEGFRSCLSDPKRPKLLYAMSEDLELFRQWLDLEPRYVLDLQIAAALAGLGFSVGYARMVDNLFDVEIDKSATRSDWLARPLSDAQCRYALEDIRYLLPMHERLRLLLESRDLYQAWIEESDRFASELASQSDPQNYYLRIRGGWQLSPRQQAVLKCLADWREAECRQRDRPRGRVLADPVLIGIAERMPTSKGALGAVADVPPVVVRRYADKILECVERGRSAEPNADRIEPPLTREEQGLFKQVKGLLRHVAEEREVPIELLAPRRRIEAFIRCRHSDDSGRFFREGWRGELLHPVLDDVDNLVNGNASLQR